MSGHAQHVCRVCKAVVRQCRCMGPHTIIDVTCDACVRALNVLAKNAEAVTETEAVSALNGLASFGGWVSK